MGHNSDYSVVPFGVQNISRQGYLEARDVAIVEYYPAGVYRPNIAGSYGPEEVENNGVYDVIHYRPILLPKLEFADVKDYSNGPDTGDANVSYISASGEVDQDHEWPPALQPFYHRRELDPVNRKRGPKLPRSQWVETPAIVCNHFPYIYTGTGNLNFDGVSNVGYFTASGDYGQMDVYDMVRGVDPSGDPYIYHVAGFLPNASGDAPVFLETPDISGDYSFDVWRPTETRAYQPAPWNSTFQGHNFFVNQQIKILLSDASYHRCEITGIENDLTHAGVGLYDSITFAPPVADTEYGDYYNTGTKQPEPGPYSDLDYEEPATSSTWFTADTNPDTETGGDPTTRTGMYSEVNPYVAPGEPVTAWRINMLRQALELLEMHSHKIKGTIEDIRGFVDYSYTYYNHTGANAGIPYSYILVKGGRISNIDMSYFWLHTQDAPPAGSPQYINEGFQTCSTPLLKQGQSSISQSWTGGAAVQWDNGGLRRTARRLVPNRYDENGTEVYDDDFYKTIGAWDYSTDEELPDTVHANHINELRQAVMAYEGHTHKVGLVIPLRGHDDITTTYEGEFDPDSAAAYVWDIIQKKFALTASTDDNVTIISETDSSVTAQYVFVSATYSATDVTDYIEALGLGTTVSTSGVSPNWTIQVTTTDAQVGGAVREEAQIIYRKIFIETGPPIYDAAFGVPSDIFDGGSQSAVTSADSVKALHVNEIGAAIMWLYDHWHEVRFTYEDIVVHEDNKGII